MKQQINQSASLQSIKVTRSHGGQTTGQLQRGFQNEAHLKTVTGSIPSKYETIVVKEQKKKSFNSSGLRFYQSRKHSTVYLNQGMQPNCPGIHNNSQPIDHLHPTPGPGHYDPSNIQSSSLLGCSKKGYNGFVSGTQRNPFKPKYVNSGPGPGTYTSHNPLNTTFNISSLDTTNNTLSLKKNNTYAFNAISREPINKTKKYYYYYIIIITIYTKGNNFQGLVNMILKYRKKNQVGVTLFGLNS